MPDFRHFILTGTASKEPYTSPGGGGGTFKSPPRPERRTHGEKLLRRLAAAEKSANRRLRNSPIGQGLQFIPLDFEESSAFHIELERLESDTRGIRVLNARSRGSRVRYLVAVPDGQVEYFAKRFRDYISADTRTGKPKNEPLAIGIQDIRPSDLAEYWTDADETLPLREEQFWWEVWLIDDGSGAVGRTFRDIAAGQSIRLSDQFVRFPERTVILAFASFGEWEQFPGLLRFLAEFRRANVITGELLRLTPVDQSEFIADLVRRTSFANTNAPAVCILDTGVNRGHPLLAPALLEVDTQTWRPEWTPADLRGHGTEVAGLALYGDIGGKLADQLPYALSHRLESVKVLPNVGDNDPPDYGPITAGSMAMAERQAPERNRTFCMAITAPSDRDAWRPSLWSATIDKVCAGMDDDNRRLLIVSAGNIRDAVGVNYPDENLVTSIEDPGQSWNALTVGAYTDKVWPDEEALEGYELIAPRGGLSPASRTSLSWGENEWPFKPDVVCEGGNYAKDRHGLVTTSDNLQLLTTQLVPTSDALLGTSKDTSAAAAQIAGMAATLQAEYRSFWPETIRALIVHSATWTPRMRQEFAHAHRHDRLRVYGWGVPDMELARRCAKGIATMVIQEEIQPYRLDGTEPKSNELHLHSLPLPRDILLDLGSTPVKMRITLSYLIEPNPSRRGWAARYRYASHGLRFDVRRPDETRARMLNRLSSEEWPAENRRSRKPPQAAANDVREWELRSRLQTRGSIHSDYWTGSAAVLATSDLVAVYPVTGWWREQPRLGFVEKKTRYSMIVTISTDSSDIELYQAIEDEIVIRSRVETTIST